MRIKGFLARSVLASVPEATPPVDGSAVAPAFPLLSKMTAAKNCVDDGFRILRSL